MRCEEKSARMLLKNISACLRMKLRKRGVIPFPDFAYLDVMPGILHHLEATTRQSSQSSNSTLWRWGENGKDMGLHGLIELLIQPILKTAPILNFLFYKLINSLPIWVKLSRNLCHLQNWRHHNLPMDYLPFFGCPRPNAAHWKFGYYWCVISVEEY